LSDHAPPLAPGGEAVRGDPCRVCASCLLDCKQMLPAEVTFCGKYERKPKEVMA